MIWRRMRRLGCQEGTQDVKGNCNLNVLSFCDEELEMLDGSIDGVKRYDSTIQEWRLLGSSFDVVREASKVSLVLVAESVPNDVAEGSNDDGKRRKESLSRKEGQKVM
uniref:Uncharacterized protein n=1 Tax=Pseudictyota dubia TaxID=2749911 RepID=A0A7R9ZEI8_9STRA|mmetsp:Transcript_4751/g.8258  ORF Transcript_4751/g.8258 Transcript_4751/m.8258 type:complete len:108 (+) Transcript_4751:42-365(+)